MGTYSINVTQGSLAATNYVFPNLVDGTLTVNQAPLTVTAASQSMTYGGTVPTPTYTISGFVNDDTSAVVSGTPTLTPGATSSSPVGSYVTNISLGTLSAANYDFPNLVNGIVTVNQAPLTVTAASQSMTYGGTVPTPSLYNQRVRQRRHLRSGQRQSHLDPQRDECQPGGHLLRQRYSRLTRCHQLRFPQPRQRNPDGQSGADSRSLPPASR